MTTTAIKIRVEMREAQGHTAAPTYTDTFGDCVIIYRAGDNQPVEVLAQDGGRSIAYRIGSEAHPYTYVDRLINFVVDGEWLD